MKTQSHPGRTHHQVKLYRIPRVRLALLEMSQNPQNVGGGGSNPPQVHSKFIGSCTVPKNFRKQIKMLNTREFLFTLLKA